MQRESMEFDVVIVGAGPAGLSAAIRLKQLNENLDIVVLEKGSEVGSHILSGAILETRALDELLPDWQERDAPIKTKVIRDEVYLFKSVTNAYRLPNLLVPKTMHNRGNFIISLGKLCRWLAQQAETLGVNIFPGFTAVEILYTDDGRVEGVATGDMGVDATGKPKDSFEPGMELRARYTLFGEGARGHLGKQIIEKYNLDRDCTTQHYALGLKELWQVDAAKHQPGLVIHGAGWPLAGNASGGSFLYHLEDNLVAVGLITDLNYRNPHLSPFDEFQRFKHQVKIKEHLEGGTRISYGARAITKGGLHAMPQAEFPGGLLIGCEAGTLNFAKIKGSHSAMKSGMLAAEAIAASLALNASTSSTSSYTELYQKSWLYREHYRSRNFGAALQKFGSFLGGAYNTIDQNLFNGHLPFKLKTPNTDHSHLQPASKTTKIEYPKPDGKVSFDRLSSVFLSDVAHEEDQPVHLHLIDPAVAIDTNLALFDGPEQRYCPAGVYEIISEENQSPRLQINAQNCLHCKTCDIKDPSQNIVWKAPQGGGGPNYTSM